MLTNPYNPDVLTCLANLSSDEVFTPPKLANEMLDQLPSELWSDPEAKFLDPFCKSGVFLREIAKRLIEGLTEAIPDQEARINHIFKNQLYGIAITDLTALLSRRSVYCSKKANGKYSICEDFSDESGNIRFERIEHTWKKEKCIYCGANQHELERGKENESHAYEFIHTNNPENILNMKFDVIIGNPPYQLNDSGHGRSAMPIYHKFIEQARKLEPRYLSMIIPARWYSGGRGLDNFRKKMLEEFKIKKLVDFENTRDVFPGVDVAGGICYFLIENGFQGKCEVTNYTNDKIFKSTRPLDEFPLFIRQSAAIPIIRKVMKVDSTDSNSRKLSEVVTPLKPFGIRGHYKPTTKGIPCWFTQKQGLQFVDPNDVIDNHKILKRWKLLVPRAPIAGQTDFSKPIGFYYSGNIRIANPGECCTESWIVAFSASSKEEVESFKSYLFTKTVRFLLLQTVVSQDVTRGNFCFIPDLGHYEGFYTDAILREKWKISNKEWDFINSKVKEVN